MDAGMQVSRFFTPNTMCMFICENVLGIHAPDWNYIYRPLGTTPTGSGAFVFYVVLLTYDPYGVEHNKFINVFIECPYNQNEHLIFKSQTCAYDPVGGEGKEIYYCGKWNSITSKYTFLPLSSGK